MSGSTSSEVAREWVDAVLGGDLAAAWTLTDPDLRRGVLRCVTEESDRGVRRILAEARPWWEKWPTFGAWTLDILRQLVRRHADLERLDATSLPEPAAPDLEMLTLAGMTVVARWTPDGWLVFAVGSPERS